jgi:hypothetical protein
MIELIVTDKNGRVIERRAINKDLFEEYLRREKANGDYSTRWFIRMLYSLLKFTSAGSSESAAVTDINGSAVSINMKLSTSPVIFNNTYGGSVGFYISVGTGTTPPTRSDYKLGNKIAEAYTAASADESTGIITLTAGFTWGTDQTITEIGLDWSVAYTSISPYNCRVLCDRTVLDTPITVPAGATLTVVYRFRL